jgi:hypothetical protein
MGLELQENGLVYQAPLLYILLGSQLLVREVWQHLGASQQEELDN